ncbi:MAG: hypothetical protein B6D55_07945 [Candidatus Omnitrophica bacterium 4484_70.2]|nr:MAG: hypothetical protein B6D55_07945 [Candidatus Omnitrophica bacterium 4484_70.2]
MSNTIKEKLKNLPDRCGVYIMKSEKGEVLYIGKASSLKKRVTSHFLKKNLPPKDRLLTDKVKDIDYILCDTQEQALILEASLIKEMQPRYNIALRDDKSYPYVEVTINEPFPRVFISRPKKKTNNILFGPYPNVKLLKKALELIRKIFPFRSCARLPKTACLYYHLNFCPAPCKGMISPQAYKENIDNLFKILKGERKILIEKLQKKMEKLAEEQKFEEAAKVRDKLIAVYTLYSGQLQFNQLTFLKEILNLDKFPLHIEAIDISCLSLKEATGSVVVFKDGLPVKEKYRRYKIKEEISKNDYRMVSEVVRRRYTRLLKEKKKLPDLIMIDGGLSHVNIACEELKKLKLEIPIIGLAKRNEEIWLPNRNTPLIISKAHPSLQLLQRIRDEAHRFAHSYHTILRRKKVIGK